MKEFSKKLKAYYLKERIWFYSSSLVLSLLLTLLAVAEHANVPNWYVIKVLLINLVILVIIEVFYYTIKYLIKNIIYKVKKKKVVK